MSKKQFKAESKKLLDLMIYAYVLNPGSGASSVESLAAMFLGESIGASPCPEVLMRLEGAMREKIKENKGI